MAAGRQTTVGAPDSRDREAAASCRPSRRPGRSSTRSPRGCAICSRRRPPRDALSRRTCSARFALHGYALVTLPAFEFAEVLERGLGDARSERRAALRRARVGRGRRAPPRHDAADRAHGRDAPARAPAARSASLRGHGAAPARAGARASTGRSRRSASSSPACAGPDGDLELLALAADGAARGGPPALHDRPRRRRHRARAARGSPPRASRRALSDALARKDDARSDRTTPTLRAARATVLSGGRATRSSRARALLATTPAAAGARACSRSSTRRVARGPRRRTSSADLGEVRGFAYYTGTIFHAYARGHRRRHRRGRPLRRSARALRRADARRRLRARSRRARAGAARRGRHAARRAERVVVVGAGRRRARRGAAARGRRRGRPRRAAPTQRPRWRGRAPGTSPDVLDTAAGATSRRSIRRRRLT